MVTILAARCAAGNSYTTGNHTELYHVTTACCDQSSNFITLSVLLKVDNKQVISELAGKS